MSIVGTRPPTLDEWNKYELHHRARLSIKPGIDGLKNAMVACIENPKEVERRGQNAREKVKGYTWKQYNADIVLYGYNVVDSNGKKVKECIPKPYKTFYKNEEIQKYVLPNMIATDPNAGDEFWMSMCGGLFSMRLINEANWRLASERDIISEDVYSLLQLYNSVTSVAFLAEPFYYYCANMGSLTHTLRVDRYGKCGG